MKYLQETWTTFEEILCKFRVDENVGKCELKRIPLFSRLWRKFWGNLEAILQNFDFFAEYTFLKALCDIFQILLISCNIFLKYPGSFSDILCTFLHNILKFSLDIFQISSKIRSKCSKSPYPIRRTMCMGMK